MACRLTQSITRFSIFWALTLSCILALVSPVATFALQATPQINSPQETAFQEIQVFAQALSLVKAADLRHRPDTFFLMSALSAMAEAFDRYSHFIPPELLGLFVEQFRDQVTSIGIDVRSSGDQGIEVVSVAPESPAQKAGVRPHDVITAVDGQSLAGLRVIDGLLLIHRPGLGPGTTLKLMIQKQGVGGTKTVSLTRELQRRQTISARLLERGYGILAIRAFMSATPADFRRAVQELEKAGPLVGMVIDLRGNPGGELSAAADVVRTLVKDGVITTTESQFPDARFKLQADGRDVFNWPAVVVVDGGSASAAELVAGALKHHHRAVVIGERTFGKGTFQSFIPIADDMGMYLTMGRYLLPDGSSVDGVGLDPEVHVKVMDDDQVMQVALRILKKS